MKDLKLNRLKILAFFGVFLLLALFFLGYGAQTNQQTNKRYDGIIKTIAAKYNLEASLISSIIKAESNHDPMAISSKGAMGLMQLMPETAKKYGVNNVFDPKDNIEGGVKYLNDLIKLYDRQTNLVLAAYNAGQEAIKKYGGIPPYPETRNYIEKIRASYKNSTIRNKTRIYKFYDSSGRMVLTNSSFLYYQHKKKIKDNKDPI